MLVDQETFGILTVSASPSVINALAEGITNTSLMIGQFPEERIKVLNNYNKGSGQSFILTTSGSDKGYAIPAAELSVAKVIKGQKVIFDIQVMETVPEEFTEKRKIANRRQHVLSAIETKLERYAGRVVHSSVDDLFIPHMTVEVNNCKPNEGYYTDALIEYATSSDLTVDQAFQECRMITSSTNITVMRLHAYWKYFIKYINSLDLIAPESMSEAIALAEFKLRSGM